MIRKIAIVGVAALSLAACTQREVTWRRAWRRAPALRSARLPPAATSKARSSAPRSARAAGAILGRVTDRPGYCYARDQYGQTIVVQCPPGY